MLSLFTLSDPDPTSIVPRFRVCTSVLLPLVRVSPPSDPDSFEVPPSKPASI